MRGLIGSNLVFAFTLALLVSATACDRPPSADKAAEWTPRDHGSTGEDNGKTAQQAATAGQPSGDGARRLVELTWQSQCTVCHGTMGHGDGPNGPMVKATNLASEEWQSKVTDAQIAEAIKIGKGKMPKFDLSEPVLAGLVARIRATRGR